MAYLDECARRYVALWSRPSRQPVALRHGTWCRDWPPALGLELWLQLPAPSPSRRSQRRTGANRHSSSSSLSLLRLRLPPPAPTRTQPDSFATCFCSTRLVSSVSSSLWAQGRSCTPAKPAPRLFGTCSGDLLNQPAPGDPNLPTAKRRELASSTISSDLCDTH